MGEDDVTNSGSFGVHGIHGGGLAGGLKETNLNEIMVNRDKMGHTGL